MSTDYDGIKYYSANDMSIGFELREAQPIIEAFDPQKKYDNINQIIELFNIDRLVNAGVSLSEWEPGTLEKYKAKLSPVKGILGRFFSQISDDNLTAYYDQVASLYIEDFWELFTRFEVYKRVSGACFFSLICRPDVALHMIVRHKNLVEAYDEQIAEVLRHSDQTPRILASMFLEHSTISYYLPKHLSHCEFEGVFQRYIDSENASPILLQLLETAKSTKECPISDLLRLNAKKRIESIFENPNGHQFIQGVSFGIRLTFTEQDEPVKKEHEGMVHHYSYDVNWLKENIDYPSILNNFIYIFEMFDGFFRSRLVSVKSEISSLERVFATNGLYDYSYGHCFTMNDHISTIQTNAYYQFLQSHGVNLEDVFVWFFDSYLPEEFNANGFKLRASSASTTYVEKCRNLASEMDGVLKQFRMYVRDGKINRELFEMSSEQFKIDDIPSLISGKYLYSSGDNIKKEMTALFSDQSLLATIDRTETKYPTLFELLINETVFADEFKFFQANDIRWLVDRGSIFISPDNAVHLVIPRVAILKDLYDHDVLCMKYMNDYSEEINNMISQGDLQIKDTLFSDPETDYLSFMLNKSKFNNGRDLRNKYAHSTYPEDEQEQQQDYIELLKIMVLVITKINEEFCLLADDQKEEGEV